MVKGIRDHVRMNADPQYIIAKLNPVGGPNLPVHKLKKQISNIRRVEVPKIREVFGEYNQNDRVSCIMKLEELQRKGMGIYVNNLDSVSDLNDSFIVLATKELWDIVGYEIGNSITHFCLFSP